jgi:hypothetical protein
MRDSEVRLPSRQTARSVDEILEEQMTHSS